MNEESIRRLLDEEPRPRGKRERSLYHATPWRLKVGTNLRPRMSGFTVIHSPYKHAVWMMSTLKASRRTAAEIVADLQVGRTGYAGTMANWGDPELQRVQGCWIYRVRPSGPVMSMGVGLGPFRATVFPVRILEEFDRWGSPEKNNLEPRRPLSAHELAEQAIREDFNWWNRSFDRMFRNLWRGYLWAKKPNQGAPNHDEKLQDEVEMLRTTLCMESIPQATLTSEFVTLFDRARDKHHGRELFIEYCHRCFRRASLESAVSLEANRHKWHRKLTRDRRYKRERFDWRRES